MNPEEQTALTTGNQSLSKRSTVLILAIACGLAIANVYYNQPLLGHIGRSLEIPVKQVGFIPFLTQIGYATGLLLLVPLGDRMERRNLITTMLALLSGVLVAEAVSVNLIWLSIASFGLGFCSIVAHLVLPLVAYMTPPDQRGKVIGTLLSGMILSVLLARTVSGAIAEHFGWRTVYAISYAGRNAIAAGLMLVLALTVRKQIPVNKPSSTLSYQQLMASLVYLFRQQPVLREASFNIA